MDTNQTKATIEAVKLVLRLYIFSIVPILGMILIQGIDVTTGAIEINWIIFRAVFLYQTVTFVLAGLDKYKHEYLKSIDPEGTKGQSMGIVKF